MGWQIGSDFWVALLLPLPESFLDVLMCWDLTISCEEIWVAEPPIPPTFMEWHWSRKWRCCGKLFVMNEVDDVQSIRALAFVVEPSGHTVSNTGWQPPNCELCVTVPGVWLKGEAPLVYFWASVLMWSQEWWGFWHFLYLWPHGHCLLKCPGFKQLMQCLCSLRRAMICPRGDNLNFRHVHVCAGSTGMIVWMCLFFA